VLAAEPFYYNVLSGKTQWEKPEEMAWKQVASEEHPGRYS
jgi:hypothetical protein